MMYMGYFSLTPALLALIACLIFSRFFLLARKRRLRDDINNSIFMFQDFRLIIGKVGGGGIGGGGGGEVIRVIWFVVESNLKTLKRTTLVS